MDDDQLVQVLKALADPNRFRMVREVAAHGELTCSRLGARLPLSQPTVSHHLKVLVDAGVLRVRRDGTQHRLSVDDWLLDQVTDLLPRRLKRRRRAAI